MKGPCGKDRPRWWGPFGPILVSPACCRSSVVEHSIGNGEVDSSILSGSTIHSIGKPRKPSQNLLRSASSANARQDAQFGTGGREHRAGIIADLGFNLRAPRIAFDDPRHRGERSGPVLGTKYPGVCGPPSVPTA